jgi:hypothetical protein
LYLKEGLALASSLLPPGRTLTREFRRQYVANHSREYARLDATSTLWYEEKAHELRGMKIERISDARVDLQTQMSLIEQRHKDDEVCLCLLLVSIGVLRRGQGALRSVGEGSSLQPNLG